MARKHEKVGAFSWFCSIVILLGMIACCVLFWDQLRAWGDQLAALYAGWAIEPIAQWPAPADKLHAGLQAAMQLLLYSVETAARYAPLLAVALLGGVLLSLCGFARRR